MSWFSGCPAIFLHPARGLAAQADESLHRSESAAPAALLTLLLLLLVLVPWHVCSPVSHYLGTPCRTLSACPLCCSALPVAQAMQKAQQRKDWRRIELGLNVHSEDAQLSQ